MCSGACCSPGTPDFARKIKCTCTNLDCYVVPLIGKEEWIATVCGSGPGNSIIEREAWLVKKVLKLEELGGNTNVVDLFTISRPTAKECVTALGACHFATQKILSIDAVFLANFLQQSRTVPETLRLVSTLESIWKFGADLNLPFDGLDEIAEIVTDASIHSAVAYLGINHLKDERILPAISTFDGIFMRVITAVSWVESVASVVAMNRLYADWKKKCETCISHGSIISPPETPVVTDYPDHPDMQSEPEVEVVEPVKPSSGWGTYLAVAAVVLAVGALVRMRK